MRTRCPPGARHALTTRLMASSAWPNGSPPPCIVWCMSPLDVWHRRLEETLADTLPMACVNAMRARRFAQAMGCKAKTDAVDAQVLAAMGAAMPLRRTPVRSPTRRDLQELHRARDVLIKDRTAALHRQKHVRHALLKRQLHHRLAQSRRQLEALDQAIAKLVDDDADRSRQSEVLASIPGIAQVTATGLLAHMPELGRLDAKAAASSRLWTKPSPSWSTMMRTGRDNPRCWRRSPASHRSRPPACSRTCPNSAASTPKPPPASPDSPLQRANRVNGRATASSVADGHDPAACSTWQP